eukprot:CAMPEP_0206189626 /NCGR_PEP_ID=MMETSP0166-20121206/4280_1 /ASSEMBLY_ACC=CAM_ASM_000260 /TAXON_ID=95228 /ORGANISM="Vannella robusta, Strain DIVA3 518/3/11/1/6" /LENGTH=1101 /DNA_ID=CAMNT_0053605577 /DNA_START=24 /DNA_END=3331 /DNA_ORIENTATION=+
MQRPKKNPSKSAVWKWFLSLDLDEKARVLSIEDKDSVQLIQKMFKKKAQDGEGLFFAVDDGFEDMVDHVPQSSYTKKSQYIFTNKNDFCFMKLGCLDEYRIINYPESLLGPDGELEKAVRLCDTREYLDTMTVATNLLEDPYRFLRLMERASRGSFLTHPCKVEYISRISQWVWQAPSWFTGMGFYSLGTFICHKFEQALWMRYWEHKQLDPRLVYSKRRYTFPNNSSQALLSKTHLTEFWVNTEPLVRLQILGGLGSIVDTALRDSAVESQEKTNVPVATPPLSVSTFRRPRKGSDATRNSVFPIHDIRLLSALVDFSMEKKAVDFFSLNHRAFIEILYFSPLKTAGTPTNYVLRRIGFIIQKAYMEKLKMDLILGEESEKKKKRNSLRKGKKKKGNNKKKIFKRKLAASSTPKKKQKPPTPSKPPTPNQKQTKQPIPVKEAPVPPKVSPRKPETQLEIKQEDPTPIRKQNQKGTQGMAKNPQPSDDMLIRNKNNKRKAQRTTSTPFPKMRTDNIETKTEMSTKQKRASLSPSVTKKSSMTCYEPKYSSEPNIDDDDDSWFEVTRSRKRKKKQIEHRHSASNSAPVSPRKATKSKRQDVQVHKRQPTPPHIVRPPTSPRITDTPNTILSGQKDNEKEKEREKESLRNRSLSSPTVVSPEITHAKTIPKEANQPRPTSPRTSSQSNAGEARSRSVSCSPQPKTNETKPGIRRSHSASARSKRKTPTLRQSAKEAPNPQTKGKKRVLMEPTTGRNRFNRGPARQRAQMHVLHTHEEEHEIAAALASEVHSYVAFLKKVVRDHQMRLADKIVQRIRCLVGSLWSSAEIKIYGSIATGLCIPESDLDLVVYIPDAVSVGGSPVLLLAGELKGKPWVKQIQPIYTAKVPVIKLVVDNLAVDITFDVRSQAQPNTYAHTDLDHSNQVSTHTGLSTSKYILQLKKEFPALEPLVLILKQYLYCVLLNSAYTGGLASYSLVLMVASYLKFYGKNNHSLGTLLLGFFELYGKLFDYSTVGISLCEADGFFTRDDSCYKHYGPAQLLIVDPLCPSNNIASGTFAMYRVKQAFANGYNTLTDRFSSPYTPSYLSRLLPIMLSNGFAFVPNC